jgi:hypothetical protein
VEKSDQRPETAEVCSGARPTSPLSSMSKTAKIEEVFCQKTESIEEMLWFSAPLKGAYLGGSLRVS